MADPKAMAQLLKQQMVAAQILAQPKWAAITDLDKYKPLTGDNPNLKADYKPLNFDKLMEKGAVRVTHQGMDDTNYNPDPNAGFSLVSAYNDASGEGTRNWKDNPAAYKAAKNLFTNSPSSMAPHKYLQIIQSAKDMGLTDDEIYAKK